MVSRSVVSFSDFQDPMADKLGKIDLFDREIRRGDSAPTVRIYVVKCARNDYDEETAYESYMNPEPGFQSGPGDSENAD
jgi:hypothetical protein